MNLSKETMKILRKIDRNKYVHAESDNRALQYLREHGLIIMGLLYKTYDYANPLITERGRGLLHEHKAARRKSTAEWARYGITTAIAITALVTAIISMLWQLGLLKPPTP